MDLDWPVIPIHLGIWNHINCPLTLTWKGKYRNMVIHSDILVHFFCKIGRIRTCLIVSLGYLNSLTQPRSCIVWEPKDKGEFPDNGRWLREPQKQKLGEEENWRKLMHKLTSKPIISATTAVAVLSDNDKVFLSEPIRVTDGYFCKTWWWKVTSHKLFVTPIYQQ